MKARLKVPVAIAVVGVCVAAAGWFHPDLDAGVFYAGVALVLLGSVLAIATISVVLAGLASFGVLFAPFVGCVPVPELSKPYATGPAAASEEDDTIGERRPVRDPRFEVTAVVGGAPVRINKSAAVVELAVPDATAAEVALARRLYPTLGAAVKAAEGAGLTVLPSVDMVDAVCKDFDDRQLAALEEALHAGDALYRGGKQGFLADLLAEVGKAPAGAGRDGGAAFLSAAIELGGGTAAADPAVRARAAELVRGFDAQPFKSRPIGFYTQSERLGQVFRRDRFLQRVFARSDPASMETAHALAAALAGRPDLAAAYTRYLALGAGVCAATGTPSLLAKGGGDAAFWPASDSMETRLFDRLYAQAPPSGDTMADLVAAIRDGRLELEPGPDAGWYDYQLFALETLLLPGRAQEAPKLKLRAAYKKRLRRAFEAMMTKRRETQVKSLRIGMATAAYHPEPLLAHPELAVEPCATNYLRTARGYRFLRAFLTRTLGAAADQLPSAAPGTSLPAALDAISGRFYGLYLVVCEDLAFVPDLTPSELPAAEPAAAPPDESRCVVAELDGVPPAEQELRRAHWRAARRWLASASADAAVGSDQRVIVPVLDLGQGRARYWAVLGAQLTKVRATYAIPPEVMGRSITWKESEYVLPASVFREVTLGKVPPTRAELRAACDREGSVDGALAALGAAGAPPIPWRAIALGAAALIGGLALVARRAKAR